jgi:hypothetical protein
VNRSTKGYHGMGDVGNWAERSKGESSLDGAMRKRFPTRWALHSRIAEANSVVRSRPAHVLPRTSLDALDMLSRPTPPVRSEPDPSWNGAEALRRLGAGLVFPLATIVWKRLTGRMIERALSPVGTVTAPGLASIVEGK